MHLQDILTPKEITNPVGIRRLISRFARRDNWHNLNLRTANLGYGWIHYALIRVLEPSRVLCIGSRYGFVPAICALACRDNRRGVVDFVDAGYDQANPHHKSHWGGVGLWKRVKVADYFHDFKLDNYLRLYVATSAEFYKNFRRRSWDYVYLDGDHSYRGVAADFRRFWPRVKPNGYLGLHDIYLSRLGKLQLGVQKFWAELKTKKTYNMVEFPGKFGLGLIPKT